MQSADRTFAMVRDKLNSQRGASLVECALLVALIATMGIASVKMLGLNTGASFCHSAGQIADQQTTTFDYTSYECGANLNDNGGDDF